MSNDERGEVHSLPEIELSGVFSGYGVVVRYRGSVADISMAVARLRQLGIQPLPSGFKGSPSTKAQPIVDAQGRPCCPVHGRVLKEHEQYGLSCNAKADISKGERANSRGYCGLKFARPE